MDQMTVAELEAAQRDECKRWAGDWSSPPQRVPGESADSYANRLDRWADRVSPRKCRC